VLRRGTTARFVEFTHLLTDLKLSFEGRGDSASLVEPLYKVDVLLIDELGKGRCTEFEHTVLDDLVSRRYNAGLTILATTNFDPKLPATGQPVANLARATGPDGAAALRPSLRDRVDPRVFSRLQEMCDFLPVSGPDHREQAGRPRRATTRT
jgi:DNA replication protein DnaC